MRIVGVGSIGIVECDCERGIGEDGRKGGEGRCLGKKRSSCVYFPCLAGWMGKMSWVFGAGFVLWGCWNVIY